MSVWIANLRGALQDQPVVILHGNVRDRYIGRAVYANLSDLIAQLTGDLGLTFTERVIYDPVGQERRTPLAGPAPAAPAPSPPPDDELGGTRPAAAGPQQRPVPPSRILATWMEQTTATAPSRLFVLFYLDQLIAYKDSYQDDEREVLLRLEKLIENLAPPHRLVMVALLDTQLPRELYTHSPKVRVLHIPLPDKFDRLAYLHHRLGAAYAHAELAADLSDGLYLYDLDAIAAALRGQPQADAREVQRLVNRHRLGERDDHWGRLDIQRLAAAEHWFAETAGVKGQTEAIERVVDMLVLARAGLTGMASGTAAKPKGVLFFAGPTGVGKTFVAKKLAQFLFSTEEAFIRFDMSEFKEEHTVSKLIGSPPGYVGSERGGLLTNAVRERPFSVLLFDEIEKANPRILDIFLQLLDEGRLTDSRGQTVFFTETAVVFTSNIGARALDSQGRPTDEQERLERLLAADLGEDERKALLREHFRGAVERFFLDEIARPELLNRIGNNIIPFNYIHAMEVQREIVRSHLERIAAEFADKYRCQGHRVAYGVGLVEGLVARHGKRIRRFGGRGIANAINDEVMLPLARAVLSSEAEQVQHRRFRVEPDADGRIEVREDR